VSTTLYNTDLLRLATSLADWPRLADPDATSEKRSVICGSRVAVDLTLDDEHRVIAFGQDVKACALGQASAALLAKNIIGRNADEIERASETLSEYLAGTANTIGDWPGLGALEPAKAYPARHASIRLPFEAAAEAVRLAGIR
jgi:NifU-like protein involved in Fe-S cluster formation